MHSTNVDQILNMKNETQIHYAGIQVSQYIHYFDNQKAPEHDTEQQQLEISRKFANAPHLRNEEVEKKDLRKAKLKVLGSPNSNGRLVIGIFAARNRAKRRKKYWSPCELTIGQF